MATVPFVKEPMRQHYRYRPEYDIRNLATLPAGLGCRFLVCVIGECGALVAKSWHRKRPPIYSTTEISLEFGDTLSHNTARRA